MATFFRNKVIKDVGRVPIPALETDGSTTATVIGVSLANVSGTTVMASVLLRDDTSVTGYYLKDVMVPANSSLRALNGGEKLILGNNNQLLVQSNVDDTLDAIISYVEIV